MKRSNAFRSWSTPVKSFGCALPTAREYPVNGASMNTRSVLSSKEYWFGTSLNGGPAVALGLSVSIRTGENDPICNQRVADPGPPLYRKLTGRDVGSAPSKV